MTSASQSNVRPSLSFTRVGLLIGTPIAVVFGTNAFSWAASIKTWTSGETLTATDLNASFDSINAAMVDLTTDQAIAGNKSFRAGVAVQPGAADATLLLESTTADNFSQAVQFKDPSSTWYVGNRFSQDANGFGIGRTGAKSDLVVDSNGNVGIGAPTPTALFQVGGTAGNATGVWSTVSDQRLKRDIKPIEGALATVTSLHGVSFRWKDRKKDQDYGRVDGFIAQEVERIKPSWVTIGADGYRQIQTIGMDALLVESIKEQQHQIETLRAENGDLKARLDRIEQGLTRRGTKATR